jgi:hypothetical protein
MNLTVTSQNIVDLSADLLVVPLTEEAHASALSALGEDVDPVFQRGARDFDGGDDQSMLLYLGDAGPTRPRSTKPTAPRARSHSRARPIAVTSGA